MQQDETLRLLCDEAWTGAHSFALYRQPGEQRYTFVTAASDPQRLTTLSDVGRPSGVVVAPWQAGAASPLLLIPADSVVLAVGFRPRPSLASQLAGAGMELYQVGGGSQVGSVMTAVGTGYTVGRKV